MNTGELLLRAVLASPEDDLPRLVYADWCDENGQGERADFIRVQCELARGRQCGWGGGAWECAEWNRIHRPGKPMANYCDPCRQHDINSRRELELWKSIEKKQFSPWHKGLIVYSSALGSVGGFRIGERGPQLMTRRGFVSEVTCTLAEWCEKCLECGGYGNVHASEECRSEFTGIGPEVVKRHPVEKVVLTSVEPFFGSAGHVWLRRSSTGPLDAYYRHIIPDDVFDLIDAVEQENGFSGKYKAFATRELANEALSDAAIQWAKSQMT